MRTYCFTATACGAMHLRSALFILGVLLLLCGMAAFGIPPDTSARARVGYTSSGGPLTLTLNCLLEQGSYRVVLKRHHGTWLGRQPAVCFAASQRDPPIPTDCELLIFETSDLSPVRLRALSEKSATRE